MRETSTLVIPIWQTKLLLLYTKDKDFKADYLEVFVIVMYKEY